MRCPNCSEDETSVVDSRPTDGGHAVRRRRECPDCDLRFTTYERLEWQSLQVRKRDGSVEPFDRGKLLGGVSLAVEKRPVSREQAQRVVDDVEAQVKDDANRVVESETIGELVSEELRDLDQVAYLRFVSVYRDFDDPSQFAEEIEEMEGG
ncbi:MAG: transcriptional regulator NrdR [Halobacteriota archaeon]